MKEGVKFGRKPKLSDFQRKEALKRRAAGETLAEIAKSYAVDVGLRMTAAGVCANWLGSWGAPLAIWLTGVRRRCDGLTVEHRAQSRTAIFLHVRGLPQPH
jgi:hypothetical protein